MATIGNGKGKRMGKGRPKGCSIALLILLAVLAIGTVAGGITWSRLTKEHREAASLPLDAVDFAKLKDDGVYHGVYDGGMYGWRAGECDVTVVDGRVTDIRLVSTIDPGAENYDHEMLYARVIEAQSLQVDTISGATLTSKGHLQCVENALLQAQH